MKSLLQTHEDVPRIVLSVSSVTSARSMLDGQDTHSVARAPVQVVQLFSAGQTRHVGGRVVSEESR